MIGIIKALVDSKKPFQHKPKNVVAVSLLVMILFFVALFMLIV